MSVSEFANHRGVSRSRVNAWLRQGRLVGARKVGALWVIPQGADPQVKAVGRPKSLQAEDFRDWEARMLDLCAAGPNLESWRRAGAPSFMAGLAVLVASATGFDREKYLDLASKLDASLLRIPEFEAWLATSPLKADRFLPSLRQKMRTGSRAASVSSESHG